MATNAKALTKVACEPVHIDNAQDYQESLPEMHEHLKAEAEHKKLWAAQISGQGVEEIDTTKTIATAKDPSLVPGSNLYMIAPPGPRWSTFLQLG